MADDRDKTTVLLTAPGPAATVRLTPVMAQGATGTAQDVSVPAGRTVQVTMPPPAGTDGYGLSIVPAPGSGPVYAARLLKIKKQGLTLLPVAPAHTSALLPPVADVIAPVAVLPICDIASESLGEQHVCIAFGDGRSTPPRRPTYAALRTLTASFTKG